MKFNLLSKTSLNNWVPLKHLHPGFNDVLTNKLKEKIKLMPKKSREVVLIFDEVAIRRDLKYNIHLDCVTGFVDFGKERELLLGKNILVFMVRGLNENYKFAISYFVGANDIPANKLSNILFQTIAVCGEIGFCVRTTTCDQGSPNRKCYDQG